jgi:hypothetical protein
MSFKNCRKSARIIWVCALSFFAGLPSVLSGYEVFIYRRFDPRENLFDQKRITLHGELFGQLLSPSTFPSYNDLSGEEDRWNFGFHNYLLISPSTVLHTQLLTHDMGGERTKFDWHFSVRQQLIRSLASIWGMIRPRFGPHQHLRGRPYYSTAITSGSMCLEAGSLLSSTLHPILPSHEPDSILTLGRETPSELRPAGRHVPRGVVGFSFQLLPSPAVPSAGSEVWLGDLILRARLAGWLETTLGGGVWSDLIRSPLGNKQTFYKLIWGIAIPF